MTKIIEPKILKGTRDFLPKEMAKRDYAKNKIKQIFISCGYDTIETPVIEYAETLLGKYGEEGSKLIYQFADNGGRQIALRYDQTVPTARLVAANYQELPMPFRRYQISRVWRADKPAKGRYREFYQCDIDIIGTDSVVADAEITWVIYRVYQELGFGNFQIKINNRRLLTNIFTDLKISETKQTGVLQILDKLEKNGLEKVEAELVKLVGSESATVLKELISFSGSNQEKIARLEKYPATAEVAEYLAACKAFGVPEENLIFDLSLARGLDYYTGIAYEVVCPDVKIGSLCGGGRYDDLCSMFTKEKLSGVGVAFGFDRIVLAMEELGLLEEVRLNSEVLVLNFSETESTAINLTAELQLGGIKTEFYVEPEKLKKQLKYANKKEIPFVVIYGPEEATKKEVVIKIMKTGKQKTIPVTQLVTYLQNYE